MKSRFVLLLLSCLFPAFACSRQEPSQSAVSRTLVSGTLSNQRVRDFAQDSSGRMWIGTYWGLNRVSDGTYYQYFYDRQEGSLPHSEIYRLLIDRNERLWVTSTEGICYYTDENRFHMPKNGRNYLVQQIVEAPDGALLFNDRMRVMEYLPEADSIALRLKYAPVQTTVTTMHFLSENSFALVSSGSMCIYGYPSFQLTCSLDLPHPASSHAVSPDGKLWISGSEGIFLYNPATGAFEDAPPAVRSEAELSASLQAILPYDDRTLILSSNGGRLFVHDILEGTLTGQSSSSFPFTTPSKQVTGMYKDSEGNLWVAHGYQGYSILSHEKRGFNTIRALKEGFDDMNINSVREDHVGRLWVTSSGVLYLYDPDSDSLSKPLDGLGRSRPSSVSFIYFDEDGDMWAGIPGAGVGCFRYAGGQIRQVGTWPVTGILSFADDGLGHVWFGGFNPREFRVDKQSGEMKSVQLFPEGYTHTSCMLMTQEGLMAGAFPYDIEVINPETFEFRSLIPEDKFNEAMGDREYIPTCFYEDGDGLIWVGTGTNGLFCWEPESRELIRMDGEPCEDISAVIEDANGDIWVSTQFGLGRYDKASGTFTNYFAEDGLGGNQFSDRAAAKLPDGTLVFGGTHGLTTVDIAAVKRKHEVPLVFECLKVHGDIVEPGPGAPIRQNLADSPKVTLRHRQNGFSIVFAALDYSSGVRPVYSYKLEGFDHYWINSGNTHEAYYANVPPGRYNFKVRIGSNSVEDKEISLPVRIRPSIWASRAAIIFYLSALFAIAYLLQRAHRHSRMREESARKAEEEAEREKRVNQMNMSFFANVSHEFRTPLTLISAPVAQLAGSDRLSAEDRRMVGTIQKSVSRMLNLVNQMLDMQRLEGDTLPLQVAQKDIVPLLGNLVEMFGVRARDKDISLELLSQEESFPMWLDEDKVLKMVGNLLSNACKFTPQGGRINLSFDIISREHASNYFRLGPEEVALQYARIGVSDNGPGMPDSQLERVFERYYQVNDKATGEYNYGTGIGLYYTRVLAGVHHGFVKAANRETGSGAVFTIILPVGAEAYPESERENGFVEPHPVLPDSAPEDVGEARPGEAARTLVIVDDDSDVLQYLRGLLSPQYRLVCCYDAGSAMDAVRRNVPDLVLSDVAMPGKDGYSLCKEIKQDPDLCHIPVILVTAKVTVENQIEGLDMGADAYVTKPFDPYYLKSLIRSQLDNRARIKTIIASSTTTDSIADDALSRTDSEFLDSLYKLMENELANPELDVEKMADALCISRSKLFYKVKGLTGETPMSFFKQYKLSRAAELILEGNYTVTQISDITGFSSASKFSTLFKKRFGVSPSEYRSWGGYKVLTLRHLLAKVAGEVHQRAA